MELRTLVFLPLFFAFLTSCSSYRTSQMQFGEDLLLVDVPKKMKLLKVNESHFFLIKSGGLSDTVSFTSYQNSKDLADFIDVESFNFDQLEMFEQIDYAGDFSISRKYYELKFIDKPYQQIGIWEFEGDAKNKFIVLERNDALYQFRSDEYFQKVFRSLRKYLDDKYY